MFAGFKFEWPSALTSIYNSISLANFNLELLAPECNIQVNYEGKWFVTQSLPLILAFAIVVVVVATRLLQLLQRLVCHVLPFGATSDVSLTDTCIGILITGVYHLYFGE